MTFEQTMNTKNERLCKKIKEPKSHAETYSIDIDTITRFKISEWKRMVKRKTMEKLNGNQWKRRQIAEH